MGDSIRGVAVEAGGRRGALDAAIRALVLEAEALPGRVLIAPWGEVASLKGTFIVDAVGLASVVEAFAAHGTELPIDYEHQSLGGAYASPDGLAPAAGWIRSLAVVSPVEPNAETSSEAGLWAEVEWTPAARERLAAKEYRYLSPVVLVRASDRRVVGLHSAALTNKPAIPGMRPIVNKEAGAVAGEARAAVNEADAAPTVIDAPRIDTGERSELVRLSEQLGLPADAGATAVLVAASDRLAALARERVEQAAAERVARAGRLGKLTEGMRGWALGLAMSDPASFEAWAASAPVVVATGRIDPPRGSGLEKDRSAIAASARAAYRSEPGLRGLTSEEAWVAEALRESEK